VRSKRHASSGDSSIGGTRSVTDEGAARCDGAIGTTHYIVGFSPLTIDFHILCGIMLYFADLYRYSVHSINVHYLWIPVMSMIYYNDFLPNKK